MRAKEIPGRLFAVMQEKSGAEVQEMVFHGNSKWKVILLKEEQAIVGYKEETFQEGDRAYLNVWEFFFEEDFKAEEIQKTLYEGPIFQVIAGPFSRGVWAYGLGESLVEQVRVEYGYKCLSRGLSLYWPITAVITSIVVIALDLVQTAKPTQLQYWQRFRRPEDDFTEPP